MNTKQDERNFETYKGSILNQAIKKAVMYLIGTTLDFMDEKVKSGFVFIISTDSRF